MAVPVELPHSIIPRGNAAVKKAKTVIKNPTIVETYNFGGTTVRIASDCIAQTQEEIDKIVANYYAAAWTIVEAAAAKEQV